METWIFLKIVPMKHHFVRGRRRDGCTWNPKWWKMEKRWWPLGFLGWFSGLCIFSLYWPKWIRLNIDPLTHWNDILARTNPYGLVSYGGHLGTRTSTCTRMIIVIHVRDLDPDSICTLSVHRPRIT